jgi:hypothetical protein
LAAEGNYQEVVKILLAAGADLYAQDKVSSAEQMPCCTCPLTVISFTILRAGWEDSP